MLVLGLLHLVLLNANSLDFYLQVCDCVFESKISGVVIPSSRPEFSNCLLQDLVVSGESLDLFVQFLDSVVESETLFLVLAVIQAITLQLFLCFLESIQV